jgi:hypothetical protein
MQTVEYQRHIFTIFKLHDFFILLLTETALSGRQNHPNPAWVERLMAAKCFLLHV